MSAGAYGTGTSIEREGVFRIGGFSPVSLKIPLKQHAAPTSVPITVRRVLVKTTRLHKVAIHSGQVMCFRLRNYTFKQRLERYDPAINPRRPGQLHPCPKRILTHPTLPLDSLYICS